VVPLSRKGSEEAGRPLHGLRHPLLPRPGCPVNNQIPDWNDLVYSGDWEEAIAQPALHQQLPGVHRPHLPCPVRGSLHAEPRKQPVAIKTVEQAIADKAWDEGWIVPQYRPKHKTGKKIAVIGSGPAGMAAAQQLAALVTMCMSMSASPMPAA
jgi:glutamate synthase (NADPH/NADH) small chain